MTAILTMVSLLLLLVVMLVVLLFLWTHDLAVVCIDATIVSEGVVAAAPAAVDAVHM